VSIATTRSRPPTGEFAAEDARAVRSSGLGPCPDSAMTGVARETPHGGAAAARPEPIQARSGSFRLGRPNAASSIAPQPPSRCDAGSPRRGARAPQGVPAPAQWEPGQPLDAVPAPARYRAGSPLDRCQVPPTQCQAPSYVQSSVPLTRAEPGPLMRAMTRPPNAAPHPPQACGTKFERCASGVGGNFASATADIDEHR
jgi:hypothetical protein